MLLIFTHLLYRYIGQIGLALKADYVPHFFIITSRDQHIFITKDSKCFLRHRERKGTGTCVVKQGVNDSILHPLYQLYSRRKSLIVNRGTARFKYFYGTIRMYFGGSSTTEFN